MKYLMFVCTDPDPEAKAETGEGTLSIEKWGELVDSKAVWIEGDRLRPAADATLVRRRGGKLLVTDGPFAEAGEWIAGFDVIDCANLDDAIEIASLHPMASGGRIELRPFWPLAGG